MTSAAQGHPERARHGLQQQGKREAALLPARALTALHTEQDRQQTVSMQNETLEVNSWLRLRKGFEDLLTARCQAQVKRMRQSYKNAKKH